MQTVNVTPTCNTRCYTCSPAFLELTDRAVNTVNVQNVAGSFWALPVIREEPGPFVCLWVFITVMGISHTGMPHWGCCATEDM